MKFKIFVLFQIITLNLYGQFNNSFDLTKDSDTLHYFKYEKPIREKLNLIKPEESKNFFRFSSSKYYLELSEDSNRYIFYADEIWEGKKTGEVFISEIILVESQVKEILQLADSLKINNIPSDNQIEKWRSGFDGITYKFEIKNKNSYSFKYYWTPTSQEKFEESDKINFFITKIDKIIKYLENSEKFRKEIPYFSWTKDGVGWTAVTVLNKENYSEYKKYKKLKKKQSKRKI